MQLVAQPVDVVRRASLSVAQVLLCLLQVAYLYVSPAELVVSLGD
jgi:hypothetical protein